MYKNLVYINLVNKFIGPDHDSNPVPLACRTITSNGDPNSIYLLRGVLEVFIYCSHMKYKVILTCVPATELNKCHMTLFKFCVKKDCSFSIPPGIIVGFLL